MGAEVARPPESATGTSTVGHIRTTASIRGRNGGDYDATDRRLRSVMGIKLVPRHHRKIPVQNNRNPQNATNPATAAVTEAAAAASAAATAADTASIITAAETGR